MSVKLEKIYNTNNIDVKCEKLEPQEFHDQPTSAGSKASRPQDYQNCPICLCSFDSDKLANLDVCAHMFCIECIQEWSKKINTCPIDRKKYSYILIKSKKNNEVVRKIKVEDRTNATLDENYDMTYCEICHLSNREDRMLLCDGCDKGYHCECLNPPIDDIPLGDWYCPGCIRTRSQVQSEYERSTNTGRQSNRGERLMARTNFSERVRRNVNETRTGSHLASMSEWNMPTTSGLGSSSSARSTGGTVRKSKPKKRKIIRRKKVKRAKRTYRRRKTTGRKRLASKKSSTSGDVKSEPGVDNSDDKSLVKKRKFVRRRRRRTVKRRKFKRVSASTLKLNSLKIKKKYLDTAKQRIIKNIMKLNDSNKVINHNLTEIANAFTRSDTVCVTSQHNNKVKTERTTSSLNSDKPITASKAPVLTKSNSAIKTETSAAQQRHIAPSTSASAQATACSSSKLTSSFDILGSILCKQELLHKSSDLIQVKTDGSLNVLERQKAESFNSKMSSSNSGTIPSNTNMNSASSSNSSSRIKIKHESTESKTKTEPNAPRLQSSKSLPVNNENEFKKSNTSSSTSLNIKKIKTETHPTARHQIEPKISTSAPKSSSSYTIKAETRSTANEPKQSTSAPKPSSSSALINKNSSPTLVSNIKTEPFSTEVTTNENEPKRPTQIVSTLNRTISQPESNESRQSNKPSTDDASIVDKIKHEPTNPASSRPCSSSFDRDKIADIAKSVLKPYFMNRLIDKEQYKLIMKKVVIKTETHIESGSSINAEKIINLVNAYVNKLKKG